MIGLWPAEGALFRPSVPKVLSLWEPAALVESGVHFSVTLTIWTNCRSSVHSETLIFPASFPLPRGLSPPVLKLLLLTETWPQGLLMFQVCQPRKHSHSSAITAPGTNWRFPALWGPKGLLSVWTGTVDCSGLPKQCVAGRPELINLIFPWNPSFGKGTDPFCVCPSWDRLSLTNTQVFLYPRVIRYQGLTTWQLRAAWCYLIHNAVTILCIFTFICNTNKNSVFTCKFVFLPWLLIWNYKHQQGGHHACLLSSWCLHNLWHLKSIPQYLLRD